jgi:hypothetical protein
MHKHHFFKAGLLALSVVVLFLISWEGYWRSQGYTTTFDDGEPLWADKRSMVYKEMDKATVFIGSSRIKYDLDIPTWESITEDKAVQLAIEGNSPLPVLTDLANDDNFKGKLVIDVTEGLFFTNSIYNLETPRKHVAYYHKRSPTQRFSFTVNHLLESRLAFLNKDYLSVNSLLAKVPLQPRPKVFVMPYFPPEFSHNTFDRQSIIEAPFLTDSSLQKQVTGNWLFFANLSKDEPPISEAELNGILQQVKTDVDKIRQRGGQVIFVRTPSSGPYLDMEKGAFAREKFWNRLLAFTRTEGIHFADYPETDHFICPEWSHLSQPDAVVYTKHLITALKQKGWHFPNSKQLLASSYSSHP